jgi:hypothetical protein
MEMMTSGRQVFREIPDQSITVCSLMPKSMDDPWHWLGTNNTGPVRTQSQVKMNGN